MDVMPALYSLFVDQPEVAEIELRKQLTHRSGVERQLHLVVGAIVLLIKQSLISPQADAQLVFQNCFEVVFLLIVLPVAIETITDITAKELIRAFSGEDCRNTRAFGCFRQRQRRRVVCFLDRTLTVINGSWQSLFNLGPIECRLVMNGRGMSRH